MSQQNGKIVRAAVEACNREDWEGVFEDMAPDLQFDFSRARAASALGPAELVPAQRRRGGSEDFPGEPKR